MPSLTETLCEPASHPAKFNGVKVITATMMQQRDQLGEQVTAWLAARPHLKVIDVVLTQSSDASFHCIAISVFYWEELAPPR